MNRLLHNNKENLIYIALWLIIFISPVASLYFLTKLANDNEVFRWQWPLHLWAPFVIYLILFMVHNKLLAPILVYQRRTTHYVAYTSVLILFFILLNAIVSPGKLIHGLIGPPPPPMQQHVMIQQANKNTKDQQCSRAIDSKHLVGRMEGDMLGTLMLIGLLGLNLGVKFFVKGTDDREKLSELEKKNIEQQLEYLKYQINPHFFMNTLNNIHALVDIDQEKAKNTIVVLSQLMRYLLYEANKPLVPLQRDMMFMDSYISLMRLRFTSKVDIRVNRPERIPNKLIPPLLTINFVENAFKHGVSYQAESFIHIHIDYNNNCLHFVCENSKHQHSTEDVGGVGISNTRKRLELLFGKNFVLNVDDGPHIYKVDLQFPMTRLEEDKKDTLHSEKQ